MVQMMAADDAPAGGAAVGQVLGLSLTAVVITAVLLWIGSLHRTRRITWMNSLLERPARRFHRPAWVALQVLVFVSSIICALFGFIWDVSLHIGKGRDPGPLANPAHYFIVIGLFGIFLAGLLAVAASYDRPGSAAVRITSHWYAPVGGILLVGCGLYALTGFPLDDVWHRIFGQDVTLWGPTHLMMIGGACFSLIALGLLEFEGRRSLPADTPPDKAFVKFLRYLSFGGLLIGLSVYQIEYDFGVEQFRLVLQPMLIAAAAALALVAARLTLGRGAAIVAALLAIALRAIVSILVGPILGAPINWFPLYLGPAMAVELIALTPLITRPLLFGAVAGLGVGTAGLWLESQWIDAVYHSPWPMSMWGLALALAVPVAIMTGLCGALLAMVLTDRPLPRRPIGIGVVAAAVVIIGAAVATGLHVTVPTEGSATIALTEQSSTDGHRTVMADVRINPVDLIGDDPEWVNILSWQGHLENDRGLIIDRLEKVGPGHYRSTQPLPVWGSWKTLLRIHDGTTMAAVPVYLPADTAIGAPEVPAEAISTRNFVQEITILQRERNRDSPAWLWTAGCLLVLVFTLAVIAMLTWGGGRINARRAPASRVVETPAPEPPRPRQPAR